MELSARLAASCQRHKRQTLETEPISNARESRLVKAHADSKQPQPGAAIYLCELRPGSADIHELQALILRCTMGRGSRDTTTNNRLFCYRRR